MKVVPPVTKLYTSQHRWSDGIGIYIVLMCLISRTHDFPWNFAPRNSGKCRRITRRRGISAVPRNSARQFVCIKFHTHCWVNSPCFVCQHNTLIQKQVALLSWTLFGHSSVIANLDTAADEWQTYIGIATLLETVDSFWQSLPHWSSISKLAALAIPVTSVDAKRYFSKCSHHCDIHWHPTAFRTHCFAFYNNAAN